ncbi:MAG: hypothetical protein H7287_05360 [Thermoleophilia bacterium]|nr:hypothetical protein [Thermoleophilia bacterium]
MNTNIAGRVVGAIAGAGGAAMLTVGAVNAQAAYDSESVLAADSAAIRDVLAPYEAGSATKLPLDTSVIHDTLRQRDDDQKSWRALGLTTAVSGGIAAVAGIGALTLKGRASVVAGAFGVASAAVAGASALVGWHKYNQMNDSSNSAWAASPVFDAGIYAPSPAGSEGSLLDQGLGGFRGYRAERPVAALSEVKPSEPQIRSTRSLEAMDAEIDQVDAKWAAKVVTVADFEQELQAADQAAQRETPKLSNVYRAELSAASGLAIPATGALDWGQVARTLDASRDGLVDSSEAQAATTAGRMMIFSGMPEGQGFDSIPLKSEFLRGLHDGRGADGPNIVERGLARHLSYLAQDMLGRPAGSWDEVASTLDQRMAGDLVGTAASDH